MSSREVQERSCDQPGCKHVSEGEEEDVLTWLITSPDGTTYALELCQRHARPLGNAIAGAARVVRFPPGVRAALHVHIA